MIDLTPILAHIPAWLMVLFRLTGIFLFAPVLGSQTIPRQVKVLLVLGLSLCVYPMLLEPQQASAAMIGSFNAAGLNLWGMVGQIAAELLIGLAIGYAAALPMIGMQVGGYVIDQQVGTGIAGVFNPELEDQSGLLGNLFFIVAITIFVILGGHRVLFMTLIGSFDKIPLGGFAGVSQVNHLILGLLQFMFELAVRVAAPLLCLMFLVTVAMGFIARTVPQMNILSVGFSIRIIVALIVLVAAVASMLGVFAQSMTVMMRQIMTFFAL